MFTGEALGFEYLLSQEAFLIFVLRQTVYNLAFLLKEAEFMPFQAYRWTLQESDNAPVFIYTLTR